MKPIALFSLILFLLSFYASDAIAVVAIDHSVNQDVIDKEKSAEVYNSLSQKKKKKLKKRMRKLEKKLNKRALKKKRSPIDEDILEDGRFRLGMVVFAGGLSFLLLSLLIFGFGGIIAWVGSLAILIGLILMIWALLENV